MSIDIKRGTLHVDTLSPCLFTLCLEPFLHLLIDGSRGYRPGALETNADPKEPAAIYPGYVLADDLSLATDFPTNMFIQLQKLPLFSEYTGMTVDIEKMLHHKSAVSFCNCSLLASRVQHQHGFVHGSQPPLPSIDPSETYRVLGVELNTALSFIKHQHELKRTTTQYPHQCPLHLSSHTVSNDSRHRRTPHWHTLYHSTRPLQ
jgi:hypothetical protein